jgi:beta-fructofuranosidase
MNDPNGLFFARGRLHVTYQHNPDAPEWGRMHWGHADTADLVTWRHLAPALSPDADGPDAFGCWSGCVVDGRPRADLIYTGVRLEGTLRRQSVCRATSTDPGRRIWSKDPANPLIDTVPAGIEPELFRDPFVWRDGDEWGLLLGAGTTRGFGAVLRYGSPDLRHWTYQGTILDGADLDPGAGADGPMWECPQVLRMDGTDVLIVSIVDRAPGIRPSHVSALIGRLEGPRFEVDHAQQLGMGPDFYAPATVRMPDGRWLLFGWIPEDPPGPETDRHWAGALTFPRIVSLLPGGRLSLAVAAEVAALRGRPVRDTPRPSIVGEEPTGLEVPDGPFEVVVEVEPGAGAETTVALRDSDHVDPLARITYRADDRRLTIARRGIVSVAGRSSMSSATLPVEDGPVVHLRLLVDGSILELETNSHTMATVRLPPQASAGRSVSLASHGGPTRVRGVEAWPLTSRR